MKKNVNKKKVHPYILVLLGSIFVACAVNLVYAPLNMVTGGVTGLAIVLKKVTSIWIEGGVPIWITNICFNIPLFIAAVLIRGKSFLKNTLFGTVSLSVALYVIPTVQLFQDDYLLAAIFGGVLGGIGIGFIFSTMSSTGGTDLLAMLVQKYKTYYSIPQILIVIDGVIVLAGVISFGLTKALYAMIAVYVTAKISDGLLEGLKFAKTAFVISDHYDEIAKEIMKELDRGVTGINATGMYSNDDKKMLFCVVSKKEIVKLTDIVSRIDKKAFIIVSEAREVLGEGFREYN